VGKQTCVIPRDLRHTPSMAAYKMIRLKFELACKSSIAISDSRGRIIADLLDEYNFCCINDGQPTYTHYDGTQSHLDLSFVCSTLAAKSNWAVYDDTMGSDHSPTILLLDCFIRRRTVMCSRCLILNSVRRTG